MRRFALLTALMLATTVQETSLVDHAGLGMDVGLAAVERGYNNMDKPRWTLVLGGIMSRSGFDIFGSSFC